MINIAEIDKNFAIPTEDFNVDELDFYDVKQHPECLFGVYYDGVYRRLPQSVAEQVNAGTVTLSTHTSGGRVRFRTDSDRIAIIAKMPKKNLFSHMPPSASSGFDVYVDGGFHTMLMPPPELKNGGYRQVRELKGVSGEHDIMLHFPLYNNVDEVYVGVKKGASFLPPTPYPRKERVVFYGSSITQGGCVSRPGMAYPAQVACELGFDFVNLGFSGNARGELAMADHIISLNPDVFVMDYDHNAPTAEHLEATHEVFFKRFREKHPTVPVLMLSAPDVRFSRSGLWQKREIVRATYENAKAAGDNNVYFIDGITLWGDRDWRSCTMDCCHPNDLGHYRMAQAVIPVLRDILDK